MILWNVLQVWGLRHHASMQSSWLATTNLWTIVQLEDHYSRNLPIQNTNAHPVVGEAVLFLPVGAVATSPWGV